MLDWFSGVVPVNASHLKSDVVFRIEPTGHVVWESPCWIEARGSYEKSIQVRQKETTRGQFMQVSGNPVKFLQGHNAFGPSVSLWQSIVRDTIKALPQPIKPELNELINWSDMTMSRVDLAVMIEMGNHDDVHEWLRSVSSASRSRHGRALVSGDTVYWGAGSRRWEMKAYCKYCEMKEHPMGDLKVNEQFREYIRPQLRLELMLRSLELKNKAILEESLLWEYFAKIQIGVCEMARVKDIDKLPLAQQAVILRWLGGEEVRHLLKKTTFYRHRRIIFEQVGVDISIPYTDQKGLLEHLKYDGQYLREHEVTRPPEYLQGWLFKPEPLPVFCLS